jgi:hypothetical protein
MARGDSHGASPESTLPMLAAGWRREGPRKDLGETRSGGSPSWRRDRPPGGPPLDPAQRHPTWWRRAAVAVLPLLSVALAAALWMRLPH